MAKFRRRSNALTETIGFLSTMDLTGRNLQMPGDGRYQPEKLKWILGYDQWASWLVIVEWFWLLALRKQGQLSPEAGRLLTKQNLQRLLINITTTKVDAREKGRDGKDGTNHDINALLELMRREGNSPKRLWSAFHLSATSYDIISTAYALINSVAFELVIWPKLKEVDVLWREKIAEYADALQIGRTHLQHATPVTSGFWLACLHNRFIKSAQRAQKFSQQIPGKFSGAVGNYAAQKELMGLPMQQSERELMKMLGIPAAEVSTQIAPPEENEIFYHSLVLISGVLANLGDDCRKLQAPEYGEVNMGGSTSSTMAQKASNPIDAEQLCGMHVDVICEAMKPTLTLISDFQRDLRWSSVMRSYPATMVYFYQQLETAARLLKKLEVKVERCRRNFELTAKVDTAELLHLALQQQGYLGSHQLVNKIIVPKAREEDCNLYTMMDSYLSGRGRDDRELVQAWERVPEGTKVVISHPERYAGHSESIAMEESQNALE